MKILELIEGLVSCVLGVGNRVLNHAIASVDRNMLVRAGTSGVWCVMFLLSLFYGGAAFYFLLFCLAVVSSFEWYEMTAGNRVLYLPAVLVIALPYASMAYLYSLPHGMLILAWLIFSIWSIDTSAYLLGKSFGNRKILPVISPNKTWVGLWGSMAFSVISTLIMSVAFGIFFVPHSLLIGVVIAIVAQCGDFAESAIKRACNVKDSGFAVPGHGGVMDRMDGFIFTAPLVALYIKHFSKFFIN